VVEVAFLPSKVVAVAFLPSTVVAVAFLPSGEVTAFLPFEVEAACLPSVEVEEVIL